MFVGVLAFFACLPGMASAEPREPAALAAVQAFLADPENGFRQDEQGIRSRMEMLEIVNAARAKAFGEPKIVFVNDTVAIAATEFSAPNLTQTFYVRLRFKEGRWVVADWLSFRDLGTNALIMSAVEKATQAEWEKKRAELGAAAADIDLDTMKQNMRLVYGSDEVMIEDMSPMLSDLTALCRKVASTAAVGPHVTSVAKADVSKMVAETAAIFEEARERGVIVIAREEDSGVLGLAGMSPDGRRQPSLGRYLLCTPNERSLSLQGRLTERWLAGIRDLGDGVYFVRH